MPADKSDQPSAKGTPRGELMLKMMERTGVDVDQVGEQNFERILAYAGRNCLMCRDTGSCRIWLEEGSEANKYREFCPNAELFDDLPRVPGAPR
jgi:hypothetical protein